MERHWHFFINEELTTLNNNGFYSEIDFYHKHQYLRPLLFFWNVNSLNTGDIYVGIVVLILFL